MGNNRLVATDVGDEPYSAIFRVKHARATARAGVALAGCVAVGDTANEVEAEIREAVVFHIEGLREDGLPIPQPSASTAYVEVDDQAA